MYLQITTRCNMHCAHCCMDATATGKDMPLDIVRAALGHGEEYVTIGGGEPTLHPDFYEILCLAISSAGPQGVHVITNGKVKERALVLARLAQVGAIGAELSVDDYHEPPDPDVLHAFMKQKNNANTNDLRGIRTVTRILARGRGESIPGAIDECACPDVFVAPDGNIYLCGCKTNLIGNAFDGWTIPDGYEYGECAEEYRKRCENNE